MEFIEKRQDDAFNPADFGFDTSYCEAPGAYGPRINKDYLLLTKSKDGRETVVLSMLSETYELVQELLGERVNFAPNDKGDILLWAGNARKISAQGGVNKHKGGKSPSRPRYSVAIGKLTDFYVNKFGDFRHLYLDSRVFAKGKAIVFSLTGERD